MMKRLPVKQTAHVYHDPICCKHADILGRYRDTVPAWVCAQCGEAYFEEAAVEPIQDVIRAVDTHTEKPTLSA